MSGAESLFARWSRRKRAAAARPRPDLPAVPPEPAKLAATAPETSAPPSLPLVDAIDSATDIAPFLASGVPVELSRTALRRAWRADAAIRDFIGLSENAWDFNAPDGVPGFGSLDPDQVRRILDAMTGPPDPAAPMPAAAAPTASATPAGEADTPLVVGFGAQPPSIAVPQDKEERAKAADSGPRPRHGGALPQ